MFSPISTTHKAPGWPNTPRPQSPVHFGKRKPDTASCSSQEAIAKEMDRLDQENGKSGIKVRAFNLDDKILKARATFNVTQKRNALNPCLPYRELLVQSGQKPELQQFDKLTAKIMQQAEFYEVDSPNKIKKQLQLGYQPKMPENPFLRRLLKILLFPLKLISTPIIYLRMMLDEAGFSSWVNKIGKKMPAKGRAMKNEDIEAAFKAHARPLEEPATRYIIAAGIAQLLHRNPQYADQILNQGAKGRPLRFVVSKNKPLLVAGQALPGMNVIFLNQPALWKQIQQGKHVSQHEFVHMLSENHGMNKLGFMDATQTQDFKAARKALKKQFRTQDKHWLGALRCMLPFMQNNSTGIRPYAFYNNMEFLTVTLDTFMQAPEKLCTTPAGQKLYDVYKDLFKLDPLNDLRAHREKRTEKENTTGLNLKT